MRDGAGVAFLIPAGVLAGHTAAYALTGTHGHSHLGHGYLTLAAAVAVPVAFAALAWHGCQGATRGRRPSLGPLLVAQPVLFLGQEGVEHLLAGHGVVSLAESPAVRVGILAQAVVAGMMLLLVLAARATGRAVAALLRLGPRWGRRPSPPRPRPSTPVLSRALASRARERGPPSLRAPA